MYNHQPDSQFKSFIDTCLEGGLGALQLLKQTIDTDFLLDTLQAVLLNASSEKDIGNSKPVIELLLKQIPGETDLPAIALTYACKNNNTEAVKLLLQDNRMKVATAKVQPLCMACSRGHLGIVQMLLTDGRMNPNEGEPGSPGSATTPLIYAMRNKHPEIVATLMADRRVDATKDSNFALEDVILRATKTAAGSDSRKEISIIIQTLKTNAAARTFLNGINITTFFPNSSTAYLSWIKELKPLPTENQNRNSATNSHSTIATASKNQNNNELSNTSGSLRTEEKELLLTQLQKIVTTYSAEWGMKSEQSKKLATCIREQKKQ